MLTTYAVGLLQTREKDEPQSLALNFNGKVVVTGANEVQVSWEKRKEIATYS